MPPDRLADQKRESPGRDETSSDFHMGQSEQVFFADMVRIGRIRIRIELTDQLRRKHVVGDLPDVVQKPGNACFIDHGESYLDGEPSACDRHGKAMGPQVEDSGLVFDPVEKAGRQYDGPSRTQSQANQRFPYARDLPGVGIKRGIGHLENP